MKKYFLSMLVAGILPLLADACNCPTICDIADQNAYGHWQGKVDSASPESGFFTDLNFLYLKSEVDGLTYGQVLDVTLFGAPTPSRIEVQDRPRLPNFQWDPGLSVGVGYIIPQREQWQISGYWTYLYSSAKNRDTFSNLTGNYLAVAWLPLVLGSIADRADMDWSMNFNLADIMISRNAFFGKWLSMEPRMGVRIAWINQDYQVKYNGAYLYTDLTNGAQNTLTRATQFVASNDYWGAGARVGSDFHWYITKNLSMVGSFFASLLYGNFEVDEVYDGALLLNVGAGPALVPEVISLKKNFTALRPALETKLGLSWQSFFKDDAYRLLVGLFYEFDFWFEQNELVDQFINRDSGLLSATAASSNSNVTNLNPNGNLTLQGLRVQARFDF
ncbi:MAG: hypothetical protein H7A40_04240 [Chlamydiales bacterium]|nr:hypothetical protein [Chlamydiales bacterium]